MVVIDTSCPSIWPARLIGRISDCTNPESADLLPDGETFVFGNCTLMVGHPAYRKGEGIVYIKDAAFVSRARITGRANVEMQERQLLKGLTGTLGLDVLRKATARFPQGTVFIAEGGNPITLPGASEIIVDPQQLRSCLLAFDPVSGETLGRIPLWQDSVFAKKFNVIDQPNGVATDDAGNLYFGDIPNSNPVSTLPSPVDSAVYRIPHAAVDGIVNGEPGAADGVQRIVVPGFVNGVTVSPIDQSVWIVSCLDHCPYGGAIFRLTDADFAAGKLPEPYVGGLGILDGVGVSRRGTVFASTPVTGEVHAFTDDGEHYVIRINRETIVRQPADFNVCYPNVLNGEPALLVTDISVGFAPGDGSVAVIDISGL